MQANYLSLQDQTNIKLLESFPDLDKYILKGGVLSEKTLLDKIKSIFFGSYYAKQIQECVQVIFEHALDKTKDPVKGKEAALFCRYFAFSIASKLSEQHFDRSKISKDLQNVLSPELAKLRKEKADPAHVDTDTDVLARRIALAKLAFQLGVYPVKNDQGATGTLVVSGFKRKPLGCFKVINPPLSLARNFIYWVGKHTGYCKQTDLMRNQGELPSIYSDLATYKLDLLLNMHLVPAVAHLTLEDDRVKLDGSFATWERHTKAASKFTPKENPSFAELMEFQKLVILDYLAGNTDRHDRNWLIKKKRGNDRAIVAIDNSNTFLERNPSKVDSRDAFVMKNQYAWREHPYAQKLLLPEARKLLSSLTDEYIDYIVMEIKNAVRENGLDKGDAFLNDKVIFNLKQRAAILRSFADNPNAKSASFAQYACQEDFDRFFKGTPTS